MTGTDRFGMFDIDGQGRFIASWMVEDDGFYMHSYQYGPGVEDLAKKITWTDICSEGAGSIGKPYSKMFYFLIKTTIFHPFP